jgi:lactam utilization protein B
MGVKRWRTRALDRTEWASIVREAKAKLKRAVVLKKKKKKKKLNGENCIMKSITVCTHCVNFMVIIKSRKMRQARHAVH